MAYKDLNAEELAVYKWQYRLHGDFYSCLWEAIIHADGGNLKALAKGFPVEVGGYLKYSSLAGWWEKVQEKVGK